MLQHQLREPVRQAAFLVAPVHVHGSLRPAAHQVQQLLLQVLGLAASPDLVEAWSLGLHLGHGRVDIGVHACDPVLEHLQHESAPGPVALAHDVVEQIRKVKAPPTRFKLPLATVEPRQLLGVQVLLPACQREDEVPGVPARVPVLDPGVRVAAHGVAPDLPDQVHEVGAPTLLLHRRRGVRRPQRPVAVLGKTVARHHRLGHPGHPGAEVLQHAAAQLAHRLHAQEVGQAPLLAGSPVLDEQRGLLDAALERGGVQAQDLQLLHGLRGERGPQRPQAEVVQPEQGEDPVGGGHHQVVQGLGLHLVAAVLADHVHPDAVGREVVEHPAHQDLVPGDVHAFFIGAAHLCTSNG